MVTKKPNIKEWITTIGLFIALLGWGITIGIWLTERKQTKKEIEELQVFKNKQMKHNERSTLIFECLDFSITVKSNP